MAVILSNSVLIYLCLCLSYVPGGPENRTVFLLSYKTYKKQLGFLAHPVLLSADFCNRKQLQQPGTLLPPGVA